MVKEGVWVGNYENGTKNYEGSWKNGQKDGQWKFWDEKGTLYYIETWKNGQKQN